MTSSESARPRVRVNVGAIATTADHRAETCRPVDRIESQATSFWDVGGYKPVLKRINNGAKLCDELVKMLMER